MLQNVAVGGARGLAVCLALSAVVAAAGGALASDGERSSEAAFAGRPGRLLFVGDGALYTSNADGSQRRMLRRSACCPTAYDPAWSPDGRSIAFLSGFEGRDAFVARADGGSPRRVTRIGTVTGVGWSADGSRLLVGFLDKTGFDLAVVRADGSGYKRLFSRRARRYNAMWSPDGGTIAFNGAGGFVWLADSDGTGERKLVRGRLWRWLPTGRALAVDGVNRVVAVDLRGREMRTLLPSSDVLGFALAPDLARVAYVDAPADADNVHHLFVTRTGTQPGQDLTRSATTTNDEDPDWQALCTLYGTERSDRLVGTSGPDKICGLGGNDEIYGRGGDDVLLGDEGSDCLDGGAGRDWLFGASGADRLVARYGGPDVVDGGPGADVGGYDDGGRTRAVAADVVRDVEQPRPASACDS